MPELVVRIDPIGVLRSGRKKTAPDPVAAAVLAELAGADGIAAYLREDRRHIQDRDVRMLKYVVQTRFVLVMGISPEMAGIALNIQPDRVTLVPEKREEFSSKGALDLMVHQTIVSDAVKTLQEGGIPVGLFIDPDLEQVKLAHQMNAAMVEINTLPFCEATTSIRKRQAYSKIIDAVKLADKLKMGVIIGRGLSFQTIKQFRDIQEIDEFCIGHGIISRSVMVGMEKAVTDMRRCIGIT